MSEQRDKVGDLPSSSLSRRQLQNSSSSSDPHSATTRASSISSTGSSEPETSQYFYGLAGLPKLIARSSLDPYVPRVESAFPIKKSLFNIGPNPFINIYEQTPLRKLILDALINISWYKIDFVRLGYSRIARENPVVILITVKRGTPHVMGQEAVDICRKACMQYKQDIHTEMKDGDRFSDYATKDGVTSMPRKIALLGESLGPRLSGTTQASGTLGLYITVEEKTRKLRCAVTCHHVVFPPGLQNPPGKFIRSPLNYGL